MLNLPLVFSCALPDPQVARCGEPLSAVKEERFVDWYVTFRRGRYRKQDGQPWTRLGYTYDWHPGSPEFGVTEFLVMPDAVLDVIAVEKAREYCR